MKLNTFYEISCLDDKTLSGVIGGGYGLQCVLGTAGGAILGAAAMGPAGALVGVTAGSTAFCYSTVH